MCVLPHEVLGDVTVKKVFNVVGAIIVNQDKIFCVQRGPGRSLENYWEFPGGKIEPHETPVEALRRELTEELLIKVNVNDEPYESAEYEYDFGTVKLTTFVAHLIEGTPKLTEHIDSKWLTIDEMKQLDWAPADVPTMNKLAQQGL